MLYTWSYYNITCQLYLNTINNNDDGKEKVQSKSPLAKVCPSQYERPPGIDREV